MAAFLAKRASNQSWKAVKQNQVTQACTNIEAHLSPTLEAEKAATTQTPTNKT